MLKKKIPDMDLKQIAKSGQCFRMEEKQEKIYSLVASGRYLEIGQEGDLFSFSCSERDFQEVWEKYLDLHTDYGIIKASVDPGDPYLTEAVRFGWGIRILRQDLWEMIVTFLISQNNNITRIRRSVDLLCRKLGEDRTAENGTQYYTFPGPEAIVQGNMAVLKTLGLGYRDKYIYRTARAVLEGSLNLEDLKPADYETAHKKLTEQYGIGSKVADCICLFGLYHIDAFPIDTHIKKILEVHYPQGFPHDKYSGYGGILQQYMFYYDLNEKLRRIERIVV
ncbi:8-oxoguanine DNA glycosylase [Ruminococcus sp. OA3]|uniref:DNA-3-methyladenine glycosylase family protein n=1 Tax=Ruminococcus sp. OA3 TaxID=2914164 RepID=UPI001F06D2C6|nr:DNA glycosylase [Ruminococcus sp. OA3]MCH1983521.1 8-oxoguanine DNA glycosylase [Ruminococcus sp. OA3]